MTEDQMMEIKRKATCKSQEQLWFDIYTILFPEGSLPLSPYVDDVSSEAVQDFVCFFEREAPALMSSLMTSRIYGEPVSEATQAIFDTVLEESLSVLIRTLGRNFHQWPNGGLPPAGISQSTVLGEQHIHGGGPSLFLTHNNHVTLDNTRQPTTPLSNIPPLPVVFDGTNQEPQVLERAFMIDPPLLWEDDQHTTRGPLTEFDICP